MRHCRTCALCLVPAVNTSSSKLYSSGTARHSFRTLESWWSWDKIHPIVLNAPNRRPHTDGAIADSFSLKVRIESYRIGILTAPSRRPHTYRSFFLSIHIPTPHTYGAIADFFSLWNGISSFPPWSPWYFHCNLSVFINMFQFYFVSIFSTTTTNPFPYATNHWKFCERL